MNWKRIISATAVCSFLLLVVSCSGTNQNSPFSGEELRTRSPESQPPDVEREITLSVILLSVFKEQLDHYYVYYDELPGSYEEWRDSGFLIFTPWTGNATQPAKHVDYSPSANDDIGTFHYNYLSPTECELEIVYSLVISEKKVERFPYDYGKLNQGYLRTGLSYMEAKADAFWDPLDILWKYNWSMTNVMPGSLIDAVDGYMSLVPEAFKIPEGVDASGHFEFGFDLSNGYQYAITDLENSNFGRKAVMSWGAGMMETEALDTVSDNKLVLFSSDLLKAGYPGLF